MKDIPYKYISEHLPAIGGELKIRPEHFQVSEVLQNNPSGKGQHLYIKVTRSGITTKDVAEKLAQIFALKEADIGVAGLKDKDAITTQTFSLSLGDRYKEADAKELITQHFEELEILSLSKHHQKIRMGELRGNQFKIIVTNPNDQAFKNCLLIKKFMEPRGFPNYFGPQRFGAKADNAKVGLEIIKGKKMKSGFRKRLLLSALQSQLFNDWLQMRIDDNLLEQLIDGDLLYSPKDSRPIRYNDQAHLKKDFNEKLITYTGPIFGHKVTTPSGTALLREETILNASEVTYDLLKKFKLPGARRPALIYPQEFEIREVDQEVEFTFFLDKGCYATTVLREFMKLNQE